MLRVLRRAVTLLGALATATVLSLALAQPAHAATFLTHSQATAQLSAAGITWSSSGNCSNRNVATCTSFDQIRQSTISGVVTLRNYTGCAINVTAGTETGHSSGTYSHWNGYKVDISKYSCINNYITSTYTYVGYISGWGYQYRAPSGNLYTDEGNHWDILYYTCGC
ncbi:hypothetical protein HDA40_002204 [Hamadaea flava]|uniref:Uncharacterized protein n=1 Tax=Hamadaea flava TaxID=1742688 RepID=A0ABV8LLU0_9ACTN|nr:hypothetical protein [Hamadaea flava]MCP2323697.1 hypothetical protein [Hamadaea flava]